MSDETTSTEAGLPVESFSAKISDLNHEQLGQVWRMLDKQQGPLVERSQALGRQIDEIKAIRLQLIEQIDKLGADKTFVGRLMKAMELKKDAEALASEEGRTVEELLRLDGVAPGVVLEAKASQG